MLGRAVSYDGVNVQTSKTNDVMADYAVRLEALVEKLTDTMTMLNEERAAIIEQIHELEDDRYIQILYKRYVEFKRWELIALEMSYNYTYVVEMHGDALNAFRDKHPNISELFV